MTKAAHALDTASIAAWRYNIKHTTEAHYLLNMAAAISSQSGVQAALPWFERAYKLPALQDISAVAMIDALNALGRPQEAGEIAHVMSVSHPDFTLRGLLGLIDIYARNKLANAKHLISLCDQALQLDPDISERLWLLAHRGWQQRRAGDLAAAATDWAIFQHPIQNGQTFGLPTLERFAALISDIGDRTAAEPIIIWQAMAMGAVTPQEVHDEEWLALLMRTITQALNADDRPVLESLVPALMRASGGDLHIRLQVAHMLAGMLQKGMVAAVGQVGHVLYHEDPTDMASAWLLAEICLHSPIPTDFAARIEKTLPIRGDKWRVHFTLAQALIAAGKPERALVLTDEVLSVDARQSVAYLWRGTALLALGNTEEALESLAIYVEQTGATVPAKRARGLMLCAQARFGEAVDLMRTVVTEKDVRIFEETLLIIALTASGRSEEAVAFFSKKMATAPIHLLCRSISSYPMFKNHFEKILELSGRLEEFNNFRIGNF